MAYCSSPDRVKVGLLRREGFNNRTRFRALIQEAFGYITHHALTIPMVNYPDFPQIKLSYQGTRYTHMHHRPTTTPHPREKCHSKAMPALN